MILYQLPDGRVVMMSVEEFLHMDDNAEQAYIASRHGYHPPNSPFHKSAMYDKKAPKKEKGLTFYEDLDYIPDSDELRTEQDIDINDLPDEGPID